MKILSILKKPLASSLAVFSVLSTNIFAMTTSGDKNATPEISLEKACSYFRNYGSEGVTVNNVPEYAYTLEHYEDENDEPYNIRLKEM